MFSISLYSALFFLFRIFIYRNGHLQKRAYRSRLFYGLLEMIISLFTETLTWIKPVVTGTVPFPRSLHTAVVAASKMYVFGGWIPRDQEKDYEAVESALTPLQREWKCTNSLGVFDLGLCLEKWCCVFLTKRLIGTFFFGF